MIFYKLFRLRKDGSISSLFINKKQTYPFNEWIEAKEYPTKGYKFRPYFHCTENPSAPHLTLKNRVWCKVEVEDYTEMIRPEKQGGKWILAKRIKLIEKL